MARLPLLFAPYRLAASALKPWLRHYTQKRVQSGKDEAFRCHEREGRASHKRPDGPLIWLHCASVGELNSVLPLIEQLCAQGFAMVVTTITTTSAAIAARRLPQNAIHAYAPWDVPAYGRAFLDHWQPDLALIVESELWPNILFETHARAIPLIQLNARLSPASFRRWQRFPFVIRPLLAAFSLSLVQSQGDEERLKALGASQVKSVGNLKYDTPAPPVNDAELAQFQTIIGARPLWLAASTHPGEEEIIAKAHALVLRALPDALLILAPRHPARAQEVAALFAGQNLVRRTEGAPLTPATQIFLLDTIGEMGLAYRLAKICFVGGSFAAIGGHTPLEPAKCGAAILSGPNITNFAEPYALLAEGKGWLRVEDAATLAEAVVMLVRDEGRRQVLARSAADRVDSLSGGLRNTLAEMRPFLQAVRGKYGIEP